jgi:glutathione S-transferase
MTCALVPYVTLTEAGADFEVKNLNTRANHHKMPQFLSLNPKHKVPVLVIDGLLAGREWFLDHFTAVDAYCFWCFRRALSFKLELAGFPTAWRTWSA